MSYSQCVFKCLIIVVVCCLIKNVHGLLEEVFRWKQMTYDMYHSGVTDNFAFPDAIPQQGMTPTNYIPYNNVPMGVTHHKGKLFITVPRRRLGIPATLNVIDLNSVNGLTISPKLTGFPSYKTNEQHPQNLADPSRIVSVYRTRVDACNFLWFIDTGLLEYPNNRLQVQRPSIWAIDLETNFIVRRFEIPESIVQLGNGLASITVDVQDNNCLDAYAYIPDLATYRLYVYSLRQNRIWSFSHNYFHFDPLHGDFNIAGNEFQWDDGIFSITLGNVQPDGFRTAYFHPMVGVTEFGVSTRYLRNETQASRSYHERNFMLLGMRGAKTQSAMHDYDPRTGIILYSQVAVNGVSCWNTAVPLTDQSHVLIDRNNDKMIYPSDLNVDRDGNIWMMTNTMPVFIYSRLDPNAYNFRVWRQSVYEAVKGTVCERAAGSSHNRHY